MNPQHCEDVVSAQPGGLWGHAQATGAQYGGRGRAPCCSCSLGISNSVPALSYHTSDLFKPCTSNILPEAAPLHTQMRLLLQPIQCVASSATPSEDSVPPSLTPKQTLSLLTVSVLSATGFDSQCHRHLQDLLQCLVRVSWSFM